jgi:hypothetical protein
MDEPAKSSLSSNAHQNNKTNTNMTNITNSNQFSGGNNGTPQTNWQDAAKPTPLPNSTAQASTKHGTNEKEDGWTPRMEGYLFKWTNYVKGWRKRYFVLENGVLMYYMNAKSPHCKGSVNLLNSVVVVPKRDSHRFEIDTGVGILHLRTTSKEDRDKWIRALAQSKEILNRLSRTEANIEQHIKSLGTPVETLKKTLTLAQSLKTVLEKQLDLLENAQKTEAKDAKKDKKDKRKTTEGDHKDFVSQAKQFYHTAAKLVSSVESCLEAVNKFDEERQTMAKDYEVYNLHVSTLKETVKNLSTENTNLKRKLAIEQNKSVENTTNATNRIASQPRSSSTTDSKSAPPASEAETSDERLDAPPPSQRQSFAEEPTISPPTSSSPRESNSEDESVSDSAKYFDPLGDEDAPVSEDSDYDEDEPSEEISRNIDPSTTPPHSSQLIVRRTESSGSNRPTSELKKSSSTRLLELEQVANLSPPVLPNPEELEKTFKTIPPGYKRRTELPADKDTKAKINLFKLLKDAIGKDLSRITLPVQLCEPISLLQRLAEDFEYAELLNKAAAEKNSLMRMLCVAAFAVSGYSSTTDRLAKQFNALLGETYELVREDKGFRLITEQVSHHPPISACICEGREWVMWGHAFVKNKFWGKSLEIIPCGPISVVFPKHNDHYVWNKVTTCVHNVLVGTKWIEHYGEMAIFNNTKKEKCVLEFKKKGWFSSGGFEVVGNIYDSSSKVRYTIDGKWTESLTAYPCNENGAEIKDHPIKLWTKNPLPPKSEKQYHFTLFTMQLNELPQWLAPLLPRTDSRFRPDQRAFENGNIELAASEKARLEEKQRLARRKREEANEEYHPRWFRKTDDGLWIYSGGYWESRATGRWTNIPDIY